MTSQTINLIQFEARLLATVSVLFLQLYGALKGTHSVHGCTSHTVALYNLNNPISHFKGGGASTEL